jgi:hypothetical protein
VVGLRLAAEVLFGLTPHDPLTIALSAVILTLLVLMAAYCRHPAPCGSSRWRL